MKKTTVISVRGRDRAELLADPDFVYVGRSCRGWEGSKWGNPFMVSRDTNPVGFYERCLRKGTLVSVRHTSRLGMKDVDFGVLKRQLPELRGKKLGCWCCDWDGTGEPKKPCHAVVLARYADATSPEIAHV